MDAGAIVSIIAGLVKIGLLIYEDYRKSPPEDRAKRLVEYRAAFKLAEEKKDLSEISKLWSRGI